MGLLLRGTVLFMIGNFFAVFMNLLQINRQGNVSLKMPPELLENLFLKEWWVPPMCGAAAVLIGLLYPCLDRHLSISNPDSHKGEWSKVMRCIAVFVGINHASAKLDFVNNMQLSMTLAAMSIGLWWLFDRSPCGFGLGVGIAVLATLVTQLLVYNGVYNYSKAEFLFVRSWLPCIFFSGGVTMGNIGRQLALYDESPASPTKPKTDWRICDVQLTYGFHSKKKKKDWLNTSVNKENHHGLVYSKDCDIGQTEYWIIEYWIQKAQNLAPVWSAKSSNSCDPSYEVMEELWFFPCQPCYCCKYVSVKVVCGVVLRAKISQQSRTKSKLAGLPP